MCRLLWARAEFFAACFGLVFLCTASLMLLRLTRWPLINVALLGIGVLFLLVDVVFLRGGRAAGETGA